MVSSFTDNITVQTRADTGDTTGNLSNYNDVKTKQLSTQTDFAYVSKVTLESTGNEEISWEGTKRTDYEYKAYLTDGAGTNFPVYTKTGSITPPFSFSNILDSKIELNPFYLEAGLVPNFSFRITGGDQIYYNDALPNLTNDLIAAEVDINMIFREL